MDDDRETIRMTAKPRKLKWHHATKYIEGSYSRVRPVHNIETVPDDLAEIVPQDPPEIKKAPANKAPYEVESEISFCDIPEPSKNQKKKHDHGVQTW